MGLWLLSMENGESGERRCAQCSLFRRQMRLSNPESAEGGHAGARDLRFFARGAKNADVSRQEKLDGGMMPSIIPPPEQMT